MNPSGPTNRIHCGFGRMTGAVILGNLVSSDPTPSKPAKARVVALLRMSALDEERECPRVCRMLTAFAGNVAHD